ncbi:MAG: hypothetical protein M3N24_09735 [Actinomycetota bacterium]|nr:hypothetical protein [Actinomycetota bacterium]
MISPSPPALRPEVVEKIAVPLGNIVTLVAAPFAVIAGWTLRRREWPFFVPAMIVVIATAAFFWSVVTWALLLIGFLAGFIASGTRQIRRTPTSSVD